MTLWLKRAACATALVALLSAAAGCAKKQDEPKPSTPTAEKAKKTEIPEELMTQGARLFGAPFEREVHMKMTYSIEPGETQEFFVYRDAEVSLKEGVAVVTSKLVNAPFGLDQGEVYEIRKDGVWAVSVGASTFDPPFRALPVEVTEGATWSYETSAGTMRMKAKVVNVRKETVVVPLGEFEAWRVETQGTLEAPGITGSLQEVSYYVEGIGTVKSDMTSVRTGTGNDGTPTKATLTVRMEAIPEP